MNKQEASKAIADRLVEIQRLTDECKEIADQHDIGFSMDVDDEYGTGAWYESGEWNASSQSC